MATKYNIKQFTNYDIPEEKRIKGNYYAAVSGNDDIVKVGYICSLKDINKPFYISYDSRIEDYRQANPIYLSKSGMYEFQIEEFTKEDKIHKAIPKVKGIWVPADAKFKLDYVTMAQ